MVDSSYTEMKVMKEPNKETNVRSTIDTGRKGKERSKK
jgi:hypothetical protein